MLNLRGIGILVDYWSWTVWILESESIEADCNVMISGFVDSSTFGYCDGVCCWWGAV